MTKHLFMPMLLTLFDEGGTAGGEGVTASPQGNDTQSVEATQDVAETDAVDLDAEFDDLIKTKYKDAYNKKFKEGIDKRFKNNKVDGERLKEAETVLTRIGQMTGVNDTSDLSKLMESLDNIDSSLEDEAFDRGIPVETLREIKKLERENAKYLAEENARREQEQVQAQMNQWMQEAEECKAFYGQEFDLDRELNNPEFKTLLEVGYPVRRAFEAAHFDDFSRGLLQFAHNETAKNIANNIKAKGMRPSENASHTSSPVKASVDISKLTDADMIKINKGINAGVVKDPSDFAKVLGK